jgi:hypothetical protein
MTKNFVKVENEFFHEGIVQHVHPKVKSSFEEVKRFVSELHDKMNSFPPDMNNVVKDHDLLMCIYELDETFMETTFTSCFQDIYFIEFLIHGPLSVLRWEGRTRDMLRNIYRKMYIDIQDANTWKTLLTDDNRRPILLTHEYLPHPEDFLYTERLPPNRRITNNYTIYAEKPEKPIFTGNVLKKRLFHVYSNWKDI